MINIHNNPPITVALACLGDQSSNGDKNKTAWAKLEVVKLAFHDADTNTDTDTDILIDILARIVARMSACRSACHRNNFNRACRTCRRGSLRGCPCRCRRRGIPALYSIATVSALGRKGRKIRWPCRTALALSFFYVGSCVRRTVRHRIGRRVAPHRAAPERGSFGFTFTATNAASVVNHVAVCGVNAARRAARRA